MLLVKQLRNFNLNEANKFKGTLRQISNIARVEFKTFNNQMPFETCEYMNTE